LLNIESPNDNNLARYVVMNSIISDILIVTLHDRPKKMKNTIEANLHAEIDFWRSLIEEWKKTHNEPVNSRIEEALALAEYKLKQHQMTNTNMRLH